MGSNAEELPYQENEITVLVTGFAPFRPQNPLNPSWEIVRSLPPFLTPSRSPAVSALAEHPPVRILVHPEPVRVAYKTVRSLVPTIWDERKIDYMVHIGMASGRKYYSVERRGHRDGYAMRDVDDQLLGDTEKKEAGEEWAWQGMPEELLSDVKIDDVWRRWRTSLPVFFHPRLVLELCHKTPANGDQNTDIRVSEDAGRYLCDFIYYSSLSHLLKKEEEKRVVFLHVPVEADAVALKTGVEVTLELIRALVQSGQMRKIVASS